MKKKWQLGLVFLGIFIPYVLIYRAFFLPGTLAFADAPFFAPENLPELFKQPFLWNFRHDNFGAPQYYILWLYLPTYLYGALNNFLNLGNDVLIRLIFYFPATILAIFGTWKFIAKYNDNLWAKFLGSIFYGFNTYFLMLIDGGQVGVALAYGLFPLVVVSIIDSYLIGLILLFVLASVDIRIALLAVIFTMAISRKLKKLFVLGLGVLGLSAYWIIPTISNLGSLGNLGNLSGGSNFINLSNSLFLFQPHFPLNQFGKTVSTPFYFVLLLPLIFGALLFKKEKKLLSFSLLFLILAFLAKGGSEPLGFLYEWFVGLPGGVAFRDSSKFYIPLLLIASLLISFIISNFRKRTWIVVGGIYVYIMLLIYPALLGNLSGVLGVRDDKDYQQIYEYLKQDQGFGRSLYFEEKPSQFFGSWNKPALSAETLYKDRPFASMIVGKYDFFNYVHSPQFCQWLDLVGVQHVFLPNPERKKILDKQEKEYRQKLESTVGGLNCLSPLSLGNSFPIYKTQKNMPHIFAQKKAVLVVGGEQVYQQLLQIPGLILKNQSFIFTEDGRVDMRKVSGLDPQSLLILFENKDSRDLQMSYFTSLMISPSQALVKQWKIFGSNDYLNWKYELLKQDIDMREFDFGKGVALSTVPGEKMRFELPIESEENFLAVRFTNSPGSTIRVDVAGQEAEYTNSKPEQFKWQVIGPLKTEGKNIKVEITNKGKFSAINTLALVPVKNFRESEKLTEDLTSRYENITIKDSQGLPLLTKLLQENYLPVNYRQINPTQYWIEGLPAQPSWLIFSDHFDPGWTMLENRDMLHIPAYATFNGFYLNGKIPRLTLYYLPQKNVKGAVWVSLATVGLMILILIKGKVKK